MTIDDLCDQLAEALRSRDVWWATETDGPVDVLLPVVRAYAVTQCPDCAAAQGAAK